MKASPYLELANELEITKAITYLKEKDLAKVHTSETVQNLIMDSSYKQIPPLMYQSSPSANTPTSSHYVGVGGDWANSTLARSPQSDIFLT